MSGGKTVAQMLAEAAASVPFMSLAELNARVERRRRRPDRARRARDGRLRGRPHPRRAPSCRAASWRLRVNQELPDPTRRIVTCCEFGRIVAATLRRRPPQPLAGRLALRLPDGARLVGGHEGMAVSRARRRSASPATCARAGTPNRRRHRLATTRCAGRRTHAASREDDERSGPRQPSASAPARACVGRDDSASRAASWSCSSRHITLPEPDFGSASTNCDDARAPCRRPCSRAPRR